MKVGIPTTDLQQLQHRGFGFARMFPLSLVRVFFPGKDNNVPPLQAVCVRLFAVLLRRRRRREHLPRNPPLPPPVPTGSTGTGASLDSSRRPWDPIAGESVQLLLDFFVAKFYFDLKPFFWEVRFFF